MEGSNLLVGLEEKSVFTIVYYGGIFVLGSFLGCKLDVSVYPRLGSCQSDQVDYACVELTLETHWSSRSINVELQAPAARTTLSA